MGPIVKILIKIVHHPYRIIMRGRFRYNSVPALLTQHCGKALRLKVEAWRLSLVSVYTQYGLQGTPLKFWHCPTSYTQADGNTTVSSKLNLLICVPHRPCWVHGPTWMCPASSARWRTEIPEWSWRGRRRRRPERPEAEKINEGFNWFGWKIMGGLCFAKLKLAFSSDLNGIFC